MTDFERLFPRFRFEAFFLAKKLQKELDSITKFADI